VRACLKTAALTLTICITDSNSQVGTAEDLEDRFVPLLIRISLLSGTTQSAFVPPSGDIGKLGVRKLLSNRRHSAFDSSHSENSRMVGNTKFGVTSGCRLLLAT
jgi:hypothetical protein